MSGRERCDEILRLIDEALAEQERTAKRAEPRRNERVAKRGEPRRNQRLGAVR